VFTADKPAANWRRSSASIPFNDCVEVMVGRENVRVRDSKEKQAPDLRFHARAWAEFIGQLPPH
jgi:hypothetical protein